MQFLGTFLSPFLFALGCFLLLFSLFDFSTSRLGQLPYVSSETAILPGILVGLVALVLAVLSDVLDQFRPWYGGLLIALGAIVLIVNLIALAGSKAALRWIRQLSRKVAIVLSSLLIAAGAALTFFNRTAMANAIANLPIGQAKLFSSAADSPSPSFSATPNPNPSATLSPSPSVTSSPSPSVPTTGYSTSPTAPSAASDYTASGYYCVVNCDPGTWLNIRNRPGYAGQVVGLVACGTNTVQITGQGVWRNRIFWVPVSHNGITGWSARNLLATQCRRGQLW